MLNALNKKVSTPLGIIILLLVSLFVGWIILDKYQEVVETRYKVIDLR